jgi:phosphopantothenoylcysteine decarboxylase/phosphopantothenate--cysteine ligase
VAANSDLPMIEGITTTYVQTADEMAAVLNLEFAHSDALIMSAAVADAKVGNYSDTKIKKSGLDTINLEANQDILLKLSQNKRKDQVIVGFAAETSNKESDLIAAGQKKLDGKYLDLIYINNVSSGAIFGSDFTEGFILGKNQDLIRVPKISKQTLSDILLDQMCSRLELARE